MERDMLSQEDLKNATIEAIYWWNRTEFYYHKYFSKLDDIYNKKDLLQFFITKIFETFLREYSIRRNISAGYEKVDEFIDELVEIKFIEKIKNGETETIDKTSEDLKNNNNSINKETKSLLSKIAFLINPKDFSLYDTLCKNSLWQIIKIQKKCKRKDLENYLKYIQEINLLIRDNTTLINEHMEILRLYKVSKENKYLFDNPEVFKRRIFDKYLWLYQQKQNVNARTIDNSIYNEFLEF